MPTPPAISASSTAARITAPMRVRSSSEPEHRGHHARDHDEEETIGRESDRRRSGRCRESSGGHRDGVGIAAPDEERQVLEDEGEADRHQHLAQRLAPEAAEEEPLHAHADERDGHRAAEQGQREAPVRSTTVSPT